MFKERMTDKLQEPDETEINEYIGAAAQQNLIMLEQELGSRYELNRELCYPFGSQYGWGYKYSHKRKHLVHLFFERNGITATLQIGDQQSVEAIRDRLSPYADNLWENRYPCGKKGGGWIHYRITDEAQREEVLLLIGAKCPEPKKKTGS